MIEEPTPHVCQMCERPLGDHWWLCVNPGGYTTELGGEVFTQGQWEAVQTYVQGPPRISLRNRLRHHFRRCTTCSQRMTAPPCCNNPTTGKGGHTFGGGVAAR